MPDLALARSALELAVTHATRDDRRPAPAELVNLVRFHESYATAALAEGESAEEYRLRTTQWAAAVARNPEAAREALESLSRLAATHGTAVLDAAWTTAAVGIVVDVAYDCQRDPARLQLLDDAFLPEGRMATLLAGAPTVTDALASAVVGARVRGALTDAALHDDVNRLARHPVLADRLLERLELEVTAEVNAASSAPSSSALLREGAVAGRAVNHLAMLHVGLPPALGGDLLGRAAGLADWYARNDVAVGLSALQVRTLGRAGLDTTDAAADFVARAQGLAHQGDPEGALSAAVTVLAEQSVAIPELGDLQRRAVISAVQRAMETQGHPGPAADRAEMFLIGEIVVRDIAGARATLAGLQPFAGRLPWFVPRHQAMVEHALAEDNFASATAAASALPAGGAGSLARLRSEELTKVIHAAVDSAPDIDASAREHRTQAALEALAALGPTDSRRPETQSRLGFVSVLARVRGFEVVADAVDARVVPAPSPGIRGPQLNS